MGNAITHHIKEAKKDIKSAKSKLSGNSGGGGFWGNLTGWAGDRLDDGLELAGNVRDDVRDTAVNTWNSLPGNEFVEDKVGDVVDNLPFNNSAEAAFRALMGQEDIALDADAIALIQADPAMQVYEQSLVDQLRTDPRFGNEAFTYQFEPKSIEFGGQRAPGDMFDQLKDPLNPAYADTWRVAGNDLTWLLRHAGVTAVANVDPDGVINITYSLNDVLDLRPSEGRSEAYKAATTVLGTVWHDVLGAEESTISANWTSPPIPPQE